MRAAGYRGPDVFAPDAVARISRASGGLTRRINILADKALLAAFSEGSHAVTAREARAAVADSEFAPTWRARRPLAAYAAIGVAGLALGLAAAWILWPGSPVTRPSAAPAATANAPTPSLSEAAAKVLASPAAPSGPAGSTSTIEKTPAASAKPPATPPATPPPATPFATAAKRMLEREQVVRLAGYSAGRNPMVHARLEAARERLESEPDGHYSLELYVTENTDPARLERFLVRARDRDGVPLEEIFLVPLESGGRYRIWALFGVYPDRNAAREAAKQLPKRYQEAFILFPRSFAELRRPL
jgi:hypothetical protein